MKAEVKQRVAAESEARAREIEELRATTDVVAKRFDQMEGKAAEEMEENDLENVSTNTFVLSWASRKRRNSIVLQLSYV